MMKYFINHREVEQKEFIMAYYAESLNHTSKTDLGLLFTRGLAEALLTQEQLQALADKLASYYTLNQFAHQRCREINGFVFEMEPVLEAAESEVAA